MRQREAEAFPLAHRVPDDALVLAEDVAVSHIHELAVGVRLSGVLLDEVRVLARRHEADVLALVLLRILEAAFFRDDPGVCLAHGAQREADARELLLGQVVEHVALVLLKERRFLEFPAAGLLVVFDPRVMAGDDEFATELVRLAEEFLELQVPVTVDAGVRRAARLVRPDEGVHDSVSELRLEVHHMVGDVHLEADENSVCHVIVRAARLVRPHFGVLVVKETHGDTDAVVPCALHQQCRSGRVHSPAHRDQRLAHRATSLLVSFALSVATAS